MKQPDFPPIEIVLEIGRWDFILFKNEIFRGFGGKFCEIKRNENGGQCKGFAPPKRFIRSFKDKLQIVRDVFGKFAVLIVR